MQFTGMAVLFIVLSAFQVMAQEEPGSSPQQPAPDDAAAASAMQAMSSHHMDMGPHMKMTMLREPQPGDRERADEIVRVARAALEKYRDYRVALKDGYQIFLPNIPQKVYHFSNYWYGYQASFRPDPAHPTSLLYEKTSDGYRLVGAMYTADAQEKEDALDQRIPLSVAQWHAHVNICLPPENRKQEVLPPHPVFGLDGSISSKEECAKAGGKFLPQLFGWMVHIFPFEQKPEDIWAVVSPNINGASHAH